MSNYLLKIILLKDVSNKEVKGLIKLEKNIDIVTATLTIYNYSFSNITIQFFDGINLNVFSIKEVATITLTLNSDIDILSTSVLVQNETGVLYFGHTENSPNIEDFKKGQEVVKYDDYSLATENYYDREYQKNISNENDDEFNSIKKEEESNYFKQDDVNWHFIKKQDKINLEKLEELFLNHNEVSFLSELIPNSKFIKITYNENAYYYIGKIYEQNVLSYIAVGIEGEYNKCPEEFYLKAKFIPCSKFKLDGLGFYFIFYKI